VIVSWKVVLPKHKTFWKSVVAAYEMQKNRKSIAAGMAAAAGNKLTQKQLDKMMAGTEGRKLAVNLFENYLDELDDDGRAIIMDYLDWKYRVPPQQKQEKISGCVKNLMAEVHRLLDLHEGTGEK
jgi:hypothetical protein